MPLITPEFVEALRSACIVFRVNEPIQHVSPKSVVFGKIRIVEYDEAQAFGIEDCRSGRCYAQIDAMFPLSVISLAAEFYQRPGIADAIIPQDPRQQSFAFAA